MGKDGLAPVPLARKVPHQGSTSTPSTIVGVLGLGVVDGGYNKYIYIYYRIIDTYLLCPIAEYEPLLSVLRSTSTSTTSPSTVESSRRLIFQIKIYSGISLF